MNDLDLSSLATGPAPALAPAADIRARGRQRTQRGRVLVAGAAALVVAAGAGTAVALAGAGKPDSLVPAGPTPPTSVRPADDLNLRGALLQPSDATAVLGGTWSSRGPVLDVDSVILNLCGERSAAFHSAVVVDLYDGHGGTLFSQVVRLQGQTAAAYLSRLPETARGCPADAVASAHPSELDRPRDTVVSLAGSDAFGLKQVRTVCADVCQDETAYWVVVAAGELVGFTNTDDPSTLPAWADHIRARLQACSRACPAPEERHPGGYPDDVTPSVGSRLWAVTLGGWEVGGDESQGREAAHQAALLGYDATGITASCADGAIDPGATMPATAHLVMVLFATQPQADTFRERYRSSFSDGQAAEPRRVTVRCLG